MARPVGAHSTTKGAVAAVVIVGLAALALAMTAGNDDNHPSKPIPYKISK